MENVNEIYDNENDVEVCKYGNSDLPLTEYETYESVLGLARNQNRNNFMGNAKDIAINTKDEKTIPPDPRLSISKSWRENTNKQKESASHTYRDFLLHKQQANVRERGEQMLELGLNLTKEEFKQTDKKHSQQNSKNQNRNGDHVLDHTIQFLMEENIDETLIDVLRDSTINFNDDSESGNNKSAHEISRNERDIKFLTEDHYFPGLIDDSVNQRVDFNKVAFDLIFGENEIPETEPDIVPLSLLEAFDLRMQKEHKLLKKPTNVTTPSEYNKRHEHVVQNSKHSSENEQQQKMKVMNRDEVVLANAIEVDLAGIIKNKPMNDLTNAIICLHRAEIMNDYDKTLQAAEEAYEKAPPDIAESAAVYKANTFKTDQISKDGAKVEHLGYKPIEIVSYMGITKPMDENFI